MKMYTLGHDFMPPGIHAGGLRYHGDSPLVSQLYHDGLIEAVAVSQLATFEAGVMFARAEGSFRRPSPTTPSARRSTRPLRCRRTARARTIFFNLTGHGHFDMAAYDRYFAGELEDFEYPAEAIRASLEHLPKVG
jgi:tryptophan synthase beta chain